MRFAGPEIGAAEYSAGLRNKLQSKWKLRQNAGYQPRTRHLHDDGTPIYTNRLFLESSPYLLQHAHNPVNWYPWGDEAFETARQLGRPVLLSVGYSTCHWCHVMEEESFEDPEIARYLNENYIAVKVDREERPDVDAIYMAAVQAFSGSGGWPMTVWLTPDRKPFFGGTYFPPRDGDRGARMGFLTLANRLRSAYDERRDDITKNGDLFAAQVSKMLAPEAAEGVPSADVLGAAAAFYRERFDATDGGLQGAPKFPSSLPVRFLLREWRRAGDKQWLEMAELTLEKMARGGIYDQVGGGFHRYSTDAQWLVPHFEKMLYDNALLVPAYVEGYQATGREEFAAVARDILRYVAREMTSPEGAFYSATDADSLNPEGHREEGWFFTWTPDEIEQALGAGNAKTASDYYGVSERGNFEGRNILTARDAAGVAEETRESLYQVRLERPPPLRDEKVLAAWNGLMISAHAFAGLVLNQTEYIDRAERAAEFVLERMRKDGRLLRSFNDGEARLNAYLDDYAFMIAALIDLYEATGRPRWLAGARSLDEALAAHFEDETGGYYMTSDDHEKLLAREKPAQDGAVPSGNSVTALNLQRLAELTMDDSYRERAERTLQAFGGVLESSPAALSEMLLAVDFRYGQPKEIVIVTAADRAEAAPLLEVLRERFVPNRVLVVGSEAELERQAEAVPLVTMKTARGGRPTAYVCERGVCELPTTDPAVFARQLAGDAPAQSPEQRAVAYLEGEVRSWSRDNGCYSCHNNGDGARALYNATAAGYAVRQEALADTTRWLQQPAAWDENKGDPGFSDKVLARLQWTVALAAAGPKVTGLKEAAQSILPDQTADGSWPGDAAGSVGSPVTWGSALATALAAKVLRQAGADQFATQIAAAESWLRGLEPRNVPDAAALVFAFSDREPADKGRRFLETAPASDGGWGPYRNAPSEVFDTALAVLCLEDAALRKRGREYLVRTQLPGGGWAETTRPSGSQSYAQHVSTTAWALMALLATDGKRN